MKTVALEVTTGGIAASAIWPGDVGTPLVAKQAPQTAKARGISADQVIDDVLLHAQPTKKFVTVEQVGTFVAFLASEAAASITGTIMPIDAVGQRNIRRMNPERI